MKRLSKLQNEQRNRLLCFTAAATVRHLKLLSVFKTGRDISDRSANRDFVDLSTGTKPE